MLSTRIQESTTGEEYSVLVSIDDPTVRNALKQAGFGAAFPSPADWRDEWIYFLLLDRFNGASGSAPAHQWNGIVNTFQGGTYNGVRDRLDYLNHLGVGALWLSPVLRNCQYDPHSYHGYGIQNFLEAEPRFATTPANADAELRSLVDAAHARGIYVIFDIVLHHVGDVFEYEVNGIGSAEEPGRNAPYTVFWRDAAGVPNPQWTDAPKAAPSDAGVLPRQLFSNAFFGRHGRFLYPQDPGGDFDSLKGLVTDAQDAAGSFVVRDTLIRAYQYVIAKYDVDGFRIDTLLYISPEFARQFGNAMREYALSIGKKNFLTFGEVASSEEDIARFVGRNAVQPGDDIIGVDAALDFPLSYVLPGAAKGLAAPSDVAAMYQRRKAIEEPVVSSHGDASGYFVTFLDNHDRPQRFYFISPPDMHQYDDQVTLGLGCLFALQGIPCVYYGTEQGLHGSGNVPEAVREALWGKPGAFDESFPFYQALQALAAVRRHQPALRYGRQYFRPITGDGIHFGVSTTAPGVIAFSRLLATQEVVVVANASTTDGWSGEVIVDAHLNVPGAVFTIAYSNKPTPQQPGPVQSKAGGSVEIHEVDGRFTTGPASTLRVTLQPMEIQVLGQA